MPRSRRSRPVPPARSAPRVPPCPPRSAPRAHSALATPPTLTPPGAPAARLSITTRPERRRAGPQGEGGVSPCGQTGTGERAGAREPAPEGAAAGRAGPARGGAGPTASQTPPPPGAGLLRAATPKSPELRQTELLRTWQPQPGSAAPDGGTPLTRQYGRGRLPDDKTAPLAG